jgi:hypothetical protein
MALSAPVERSASEGSGARCQRLSTMCSVRRCRVRVRRSGSRTVPAPLGRPTARRPRPWRPRECRCLQPARACLQTQQTVLGHRATRRGHQDRHAGYQVNHASRQLTVSGGRHGRDQPVTTGQLQLLLPRPCGDAVRTASDRSCQSPAAPAKTTPVLLTRLEGSAVFSARLRRSGRRRSSIHPPAAAGCSPGAPQCKSPQEQIQRPKASSLAGARTSAGARRTAIPAAAYAIAAPSNALRVRNIGWHLLDAPSCPTTGPLR